MSGGASIAWTLGAGFLRWWGAELAALVPAGLRRALGPSRDRLIVAAQAGSAEADLTLESGGRRAALGPLAALDAGERRKLARAARAGRLTVTLAPPAEAMLSRRASLPLAAERDLAAVVAFEMDRLTPFAADELYWRCAVAARRPAQDALDIDLWFTPRARFAGLAAALAEAGLGVAAAAAPGPDGALLALSGAGLGGTGRGGTGRGGAATRWGARLAALGCIACVMLFAAWIAMDTQALQERAQALETEAASLRRAAIAAQDQRRAADAADAARLAVDLRQSAPLASEALAELSAILPDDAWLTALRLTEGSVEITGQAADAAALVALIDAAPGFASPRFLAPITREPGEAGERFTLSARRVGGGTP